MEKVAVAIDLETQTATPTVLVHLATRKTVKKEKGRVTQRKENPHPTTVPLATASQENPAATAV
jgi:hypothetical protein